MELWEELREEALAEVSIETDLRIEEKAVVTGAGDSYAAGLVLAGSLPRSVRVVDPLTAATNDFDEPLLVAVSVSGKTARVLDAVKFQKSRGKKVIAVTANESSELVKLAHETLILPFKGKPGVPGALTYLETIVALHKLFGVEIEDSKRITRFELREGTAFLGCGPGRGIAYFAYLKLAETFGWWSLSENLELFAHSPMFIKSLNEIVIFSCGSRLEEELERRLDNVTVVRGSAIDQTRSIILTLSETARSLGLQRPYFLTERNLLEKSSYIIYDYHLT